MSNRHDSNRAGDELMPTEAELEAEFKVEVQEFINRGGRVEQIRELLDAIKANQL